MNIHEYQAKDLMKKFGIKVLGGQVAHTVDEAVEAAKKLDSDVWVVKAQIHAGGSGGVKVAKSLEEGKNMLQIFWVRSCDSPNRTGGKEVKKLLIEQV